MVPPFKTITPFATAVLTVPSLSTGGLTVAVPEVEVRCIVPPAATWIRPTVPELKIVCATDRSSVPRTSTWRPCETNAEFAPARFSVAPTATFVVPAPSKLPPVQVKVPLARSKVPVPPTVPVLMLLAPLTVVVAPAATCRIAPLMVTPPRILEPLPRKCVPVAKSIVPGGAALP